MKNGVYFRKMEMESDLFSSNYDRYKVNTYLCPCCSTFQKKYSDKQKLKRKLNKLSTKENKKKDVIINFFEANASLNAGYFKSNFYIQIMCLSDLMMVYKI
ncbi:unnamed protein product [Larinioides sclopetarius]|uniref:Uncharacterized protein n=1 Tax=Larinioides sclopetarius TaxID=280406 RepID=A0AAV1ZB67_9ARAC